MQILAILLCVISPVSDKESALFLTPAGKYTLEDIAANGNMTRSQKYKNPSQTLSCQAQTGESVCPITSSKAHTEYVWIIGGKTYQFCDPVCIDAFLTLAKTAPDQIREPEFYVK